MFDIIIKNGYVVDMVSDECNVCKKDILINSNKIVKIEENTKEEAKKVIDANGKAVIPGLINCHNHAAMTIFRGYSDDTSLMDWLENKIWPIEDKLDDEDIYYSSLIACIEMIKSGTTTFNDMYFLMENVAKAVKGTKIRGMLGRCIMKMENEEDVRVKEAISLYENYNNAENEKIKINIAPHALYTCNKEAILKSKELAIKYNVPLHIHLDETKVEHDNILKEFGITPTKMLDEMGVFDDCHVILAHGVWLNDEDIQILKKIKGGIVHNPVSNCKLSSGIARVSKLLSEGINVALGTDGAGSTNTLDMFEEMRLCNYLQKVSTLEPTIINAYDVLKMATINGAKALGLENEIGSIEVGKKADIILVDMKGAHLNPLHDVVSNLVYSCNGADVVTTIVDGNILMEDRVLNNIDEENIKQKCNELIKKYFKM